MKFSAILAALLAVIPTVAAQADGTIYVPTQGVLIGIWVLFGLIFLLGLLGTAFWIWMIVDCATRKTFKSDSEKIVWIIIMLFFHALGSAIYYFAIKRGHRKLKSKS